MIRNRIAALAAVLTLPFAPGCYVYSDGHYDDYGVPGDVTFAWSFDGYSCATEGYVDSVQIRIPGERLDNDGFFACRVNGYDGITLRNFAPGSYSFEIWGVDYTGYESYYSRGGFEVDGSVTVRVDLDPI